MIHLDLRKWIYISIINPKRTMNKLKGVFKPLKCYFKFNITKYIPYPALWCSKPAYIHIMAYDIIWKDKDDSPRFEFPPVIWIHLFRLNFIWYWTIDKEDDYWEQALWYLYYYNTYSQGLLDKPNIEKAIESWPWQDYKTKQSSWNNNFLING